MSSDAVLGVFRSLWSDLREKRLWPVALLLALGLVAIPMLLLHSPPAPPPSPPLADAGLTGPASGIPALAVQNASAQSQLRGHGRDPFKPAGSAGSAGTAGSAGSAKAGSGTTSSSSGGSSASHASSSSGGSSTGSASGSTTASGSGGGSAQVPAPPSITPGAKPKPPTTGLSDTQAYEVSLAETNPSGGLNTVDPLERLSVLPATGRPLVIELGVLQGGKRVLFSVLPGTILGGPGKCIPGPIDCEILSLGQDQTESLSAPSASGPQQAALFAVTGISARRYGSAAAATAARREASSGGRALLAAYQAPSLSLFQYQPAVGAVVDLRTLAVGGS